MPIYEYRCKRCFLISEKLELSSDNRADEIMCFNCGDMAERIISRTNSNFAAWSDTMNREIAYAQEPQNHANVINE